MLRESFMRKVFFVLFFLANKLKGRGGMVGRVAIGVAAEGCDTDHTASAPGSREMDVGFLLFLFIQTWTQSYGMETCTFRMSLHAWKCLGHTCTDVSRVYLSLK